MTDERTAEPSSTGAGDDFPARPLVNVSIAEGIALITLDDPGRRNVLGAELAAQLIAAVDEAEHHDDVRVLVVTGRGRAFSAGADLADLLAAGDGDSAGVRLVYEAFGRVAECSLPTIAAVNGPAIGAGLNLALACDVRIAAASARFDCRFLAIGIHPGGGHAWMLERLVGPQTAATMLLLGQVVGAQDAVRLGLVWQVVPDEDLVATAMQLAMSGAAVPAQLLASTKNTLLTTPQLPSRADALEVETDRQLDSLQRPEAAGLIARLRSMISTAEA